MSEEVIAEKPVTAAVTEEKEPQAPSQKVTRTEKEKAEFSLKMNAARLQELGGDPTSVLGLKKPIDESLPDDKPLTVKDLRELQKQDATQTALDMANEIEDESEREEVKSILSKRIVPSGNAQSDLAIARAAVNANRNAKILEEQGRKTNPRVTASGGTKPAQVEDEFVPTASEKVFMSPPYNLSKEKVLEVRRKEAEKK